MSEQSPVCGRHNLQTHAQTNTHLTDDRPSSIQAGIDRELSLIGRPVETTTESANQQCQLLDDLAQRVPSGTEKLVHNSFGTANPLMWFPGIIFDLEYECGSERTWDLPTQNNSGVALSYETD